MPRNVRDAMAQKKQVDRGPFFFLLFVGGGFWIWREVPCFFFYHIKMAFFFLDTFFPSSESSNSFVLGAVEICRDYGMPTSSQWGMPHSHESIMIGKIHQPSKIHPDESKKSFSNLDVFLFPAMKK